MDSKEFCVCVMWQKMPAGSIAWARQRGSLGKSIEGRLNCHQMPYTWGLSSTNIYTQITADWQINQQKSHMWGYLSPYLTSEGRPFQRTSGRQKKLKKNWEDFWKNIWKWAINNKWKKNIFKNCWFWIFFKSSQIYFGNIFPVLNSRGNSQYLLILS